MSFDMTTARQTPARSEDVLNQIQALLVEVNHTTNAENKRRCKSAFQLVTTARLNERETEAQLRELARACEVTDPDTGDVHCLVCGLITDPEVASTVGIHHTLECAAGYGGAA